MDSLGDGELAAGANGRSDGISAHPDLRALSRRMRIEMDETLRAEQHAARISAQRRSTLRDRLLLAEDRAEALHIDVRDGAEIWGTVIAVGADHVVVADGERQCWIAIQHVAALRTEGC